MSIIKIDNLCKEYSYSDVTSKIWSKLWLKNNKTKVTVDNISFNVSKGDIIGDIGSNGVGKSTTIKMLTGIYSLPVVK